MLDQGLWLTCQVKRSQRRVEPRACVAYTGTVKKSCQNGGCQAAGVQGQSPGCMPACLLTQEEMAESMQSLTPCMTRPVRHAMHSTCSQRLAVYRSAALKHFRCKGHCVAMPMMIQLLLCCRCCSGRSGHGPRSATLSAPAVTCTPLCLLAMLAIPDMQLWQPKAVHSTVSPPATVAVLQQCVPPAVPPLATGAVMKLVASRPLVAAAASITKVPYAFCVSQEGTWR